MDTLFHSMSVTMKRLTRMSKAMSKAIPVQDRPPTAPVITPQVSPPRYGRPMPLVYGSNVLLSIWG